MYFSRFQQEDCYEPEEPYEFGFNCAQVGSLFYFVWDEKIYKITPSCLARLARRDQNPERALEVGWEELEAVPAPPKRL